MPRYPRNLTPIGPKRWAKMQLSAIYRAPFKKTRRKVRRFFRDPLNLNRRYTRRQRAAYTSTYSRY